MSRRISLLIQVAMAACGLIYLEGHAASPNAEMDYANKCSVCHDGGAGQAPRLDDHANWLVRAQRGKQSLYKSALEGVPNTAMTLKGGYPSLRDDEVMAIVDYMLQRAGKPDVNTSSSRSNSQAETVRQGIAQSTSVLPTSTSNVKFDAANDVQSDLQISRLVAERLRQKLGQLEARLDEYQGVITVRGLGIKVSTTHGVSTLSGTIKEGDVSSQAELIAASTPGVRKVQNRLIAAALFEWD
jgi:cytochrome c5